MLNGVKLYLYSLDNPGNIKEFHNTTFPNDFIAFDNINGTTYIVLCDVNNKI